MKVKWLLLAAGAFCAIGLAALAYGAPQRGGFMKGLGLTPEQMQKLKDIRYEGQKEMITYRRDLALKMLDYRHEMDKDAPNEQALDKLIDEAAAVRANMAKARTKHLLAAKAVMTPEQWAKAKAFFMERLSEKRHRFGGGMWNDGPEEGPGPGRGFGRPQGQGGQAAPGTAKPQAK